MPFTYTNRKGTAYTLYRKTGIDGESRYVSGSDEIADGEQVDRLPPGFRVSESPNGIVSVARDRPPLIRPEEIAAVEGEIQRSRHPRSFRVAAGHKHIEIYGRSGPDISIVSEEMLADGVVLPGREQRMLELDEQFPQFTPVARLILRDPVQRTFGAEQLATRGEDHVWRRVGKTGSPAELAGALIPALGADALDAFHHHYQSVTGARLQPAPGRRGDSMSASKRSRTQPASIHQLKVSLLHLSPPIWRHLAVPCDMPLGALHYVLQLAMGWTDSHLHDFRVGKTTYGDPGMLEELGDADEWAAPLAHGLSRARSRMHYTYDFGDNWEHDVLVEKVGPPEPGLSSPVCLAGERAGPPDDCGGVWGYADLLEALADPKHPEHDWMMEWAGGPIDPEAFDLDEVNKRLARLP